MNKDHLLFTKYPPLSSFYYSENQYLEFSKQSFSLFQTISEQDLQQYSGGIHWIISSLSIKENQSLLTIGKQFSAVKKLLFDVTLTIEELLSPIQHETTRQLFIDIMDCFPSLEELNLSPFVSCNNELFILCITSLPNSSELKSLILPKKLIEKTTLPTNSSSSNSNNNQNNNYNYARTEAAATASTTTSNPEELSSYERSQRAFTNQIFITIYEKCKKLSYLQLSDHYHQIYDHPDEIQELLMKIVSEEYYLLAEQLRHQDEENDQMIIIRPPSFTSTGGGASPKTPTMNRESLVLRDHLKEIAKLYRLAAELGNANAQCELGILYGLGSGVVKDAKMEIYWHRKGAEQGHMDCLIFMGNHYKLGKEYILTKDYQQAKQYYLQANYQDGIKEIERLIEEEKELQEAKKASLGGMGKSEKRFTEIRPVKKLDFRELSSNTARSPRSSSSATTTSTTSSGSLIQDMKSMAETTLRGFIAGESPSSRRPIRTISNDSSESRSPKGKAIVVSATDTNNPPSPIPDSPSKSVNNAPKENNNITDTSSPPASAAPSDSTVCIIS